MILTTVVLAMTTIAGGPVWAQTLPDSLSVHLYLVPEDLACAPSGYESGTRCEPLEIGDVESWGRRPNVAATIPPSPIELGQRIFRILVNYQSASRDLASDRRAMVIVVDFGTPYTGTVRLIRNASGGIPAYDQEYRLRGERRLINHQSALAFIPARGVTWRIEAGAKSWTFAVAQGDQDG